MSTPSRRGPCFTPFEWKVGARAMFGQRIPGRPSLDCFSFSKGVPEAAGNPGARS